MADAALAHDAEGFSLQAGAEQEEHAPFPWLARADEPFVFAEPPGGHEDEPERDVGGGFGEHAGVVGGGDSAFGAGQDVDVVVAHGDGGDDLQLRPGGIEQFRVDGSVSRLTIVSAPAARRRSSSRLMDPSPSQAMTSWEARDQL